MNWRDAFDAQAAACRELGSPFTARLLAGLAGQGLPDGAVKRRIESWPGVIDATGDAIALRLAGALHALVLERHDAVLSAIYPPAKTSDHMLLTAVMNAIIRHEALLMQWMDRPPQTNEVARSAALIPAAHFLAARFRLPLVVSELGASAGLNLNFDRYVLEVAGELLGPHDPALALRPEWRGQQPEICAPVIASRAGVDLSPLDARQDGLRLCAYVWPDQFERHARLRAALDEAVRNPPVVAKGDAIVWLEDRLAKPMPGRLHMVFHTVAWQYFPEPSRKAGEALIAQAGARATPDAPLARLSMESDGQSPGAGLRLTIYPQGQTLRLGRADFHGRWIDWQPRQESD
ncbi:MAG: DUF2332 domain-containing protein [Paracoccaceae bacterium]